MSTTALTTDGRFLVRRKRPNRPSVDNAFASSWCPHFGVQFMLPNRNGYAMTRSNVNKRLALAVQTVAGANPDITTQRISPHTIRHTTAMHLLQSGEDASVIALWLGHESPTTTHHYVEADLAMKERALARLQEPGAKIHRYRASDSLINFLKTL